MQTTQELKGTGIYLIINQVNHKVYVGSAAQSFEARWAVHRTHLKQGKHHSRHLQRAWDIYGASSFRFEIIERCEIEKCIEREQYWIDELNSSSIENGYNICPLAGSNRGFKMSEESKKKCSVTRKKKFLDPEFKTQAMNAIFNSSVWRKAVTRRHTQEKIAKRRRGLQISMLVNGGSQQLVRQIAALKGWRKRRGRTKI